MGLIIILVSFLLEPVQNYFCNRKKIHKYARLEWEATETLQLQRVAYQGLGTGTWAGYADCIPKTGKNETMGDLVGTYMMGTDQTAQVAPATRREKPTPVMTQMPLSDSVDATEVEPSRDCDDHSSRYSSENEGLPSKQASSDMENERLPAREQNVVTPAYRPSQDGTHLSHPASGGAGVLATVQRGNE